MLFVTGDRNPIQSKLKKKVHSFTPINKKIQGVTGFNPKGFFPIPQVSPSR
jgi:hypothetical protein